MAVLNINIFSYDVSMGNLRRTWNIACGDLAALIILLLARDPFDKLHLSRVGVQVAIVSNKVTFSTTHPGAPSTEVSLSISLT